MRSAAPLLAAAGLALTLAGPAAGQEWRTITSARQVWDREPMDVEIHYGAGELVLRPAEAPMLYRMEMRYDEDRFSPQTEYDAERRVLRLGVQSREEGRHGLRVREGSRATIGLTREVPLDLDLEFGAGEAEIDLGGIAMRRLELSTGASQTTVRFDRPNPIEADRVIIEAGAAELRVEGLGNARASSIEFHGGVGSTVLDFGGAWTRDARASVQMGIGSVVLRLPRDVGVKVDRSSFLSSFETDGLVRRGGSYYSTNWERAQRRLSVDVNAAFGSVQVQWIGESQ